MEPRRYTIDEHLAAASAREMIGEEETRAVVEEQARRVASGRDAWSLGRIIPIALLLGAVAVALVAWETSAPDGSRSGLFDDEASKSVDASDRSNRPPVPFDKDAPLDTSTAALADSAWGYRFLPGQRLRFERVYRSNPYGNAKVETSRTSASVFVEHVDKHGNIIMLIDETLSLKRKGKDRSLTRRYRATITPTGELIDGSVVRDSLREAFMRSVDTPTFQGGLYGTELSAVERVVGQWFPRWPARTAFDQRGRAERVDSVTESVYQMSWEDLNDPSRHLDTVEESVLYVSAKARGIVADGKAPEKRRDVEEDWDVISQEVVPSIGTGRSKEEDEDERRYDSLRTVTIFAGTIRWDRYRLVETPDDVRVPAIAMIDSVERHDWSDHPENVTTHWYTRTLLVFRRIDGAPLRAISIGRSDHHQGMGDGWHEETIRLVGGR
jgi:hypothetical protein